MVWIFTLSLLLYASLTVFDKFSVEKKEEVSTCQKFSEKYIQCIKEIQAIDVHRIPLRKEEITFQNACQKDPELIESCFDLEESSCEIIFFCVQKKYTILFGKERKI